VSFDDSFLEAQAKNIDTSIQNLLVGETSFLALKSPPITKQVVTNKMWLFVTAYSSTPDQTDSTPFITAANTHVRDGVVAANFAYFGTKMRFPTLYGDKVFVVEDRMNSRYPYRVDIWMQSREEAIQFGAKIVPIEIIKEI
jgi:3D (Asp-Asp-Asp) domain-containing protein